MQSGRFVRSAVSGAVFSFVLVSGGAAFAQPAAGMTQQQLLQRLEALEKRLNGIDGAAAPAAPVATAPAAPATTPMPNMPGMVHAAPGAPPPAEPAQTLADRLAALEERLSSLETNAVLSVPKATVKQVEVYVDKDGNQFDTPQPGARKTITYQREATSRRQSIGEEIEEALADAENRRVAVGVNSTLTIQHAQQTSGADWPAAGHSYALASADLTFTAGLAQNTIFFADVVGLSGNPPDNEINPLTLLNSYTARLSRQNELNLREAWIKTQLFRQKVDVTFGRLDLTNYFDNNVAANDETTQFLSDALVNNPALGLSSNGPGVAVVYEPYSSFNFKIGAQQSDPLATNLSESVFALAEIGYLARPFGLPEGNYRVWYRSDNSTGDQRTALGVSVDQKLTPNFTLFARYGTGEVGFDDIDFWSVGLQVQNSLVLNPLDHWGIGYSRTELALRAEDIAELYYNFHLTEKLRLSPHLQYVDEEDGIDSRAFILPGVRLQAAF
jgi:hypothetical protein